MAVTNAVTDLFASVYELFASLIGAVYTIAHSFVTGIVNLFVGFFSFFADIFQGVIDVVGGVGKFVAGNIVIIGIIAAAGYGYVRFTQQGQVQNKRAGGPVGIAGKQAN